MRSPCPVPCRLAPAGVFLRRSNVSDVETFEAARSRLSGKAAHTLMELAMLLEQQRHGAEAAQRLHDQVEAGETHLEFALRMEATSASIIGIERRGNSARGVVDVLVYAPPGGSGH